MCANFGLPRPLCSRFRPDVRDRQTDVRQKHRLIPRLLGAGIINNSGDLKSKIVITKDLEYDRTYADYGYIYIMQAVVIQLNIKYYCSVILFTSFVYTVQNDRQFYYTAR